MDSFSYISLWNKLYISPCHTKEMQFIFISVEWVLYSSLCWTLCSIFTVEPFVLSLRHSAPSLVSRKLLLSVSDRTPLSQIALIVKHRRKENRLKRHSHWSPSDSNRPCSRSQQACWDPDLWSQGGTGVCRSKELPKDPGHVVLLRSFVD